MSFLRRDRGSNTHQKVEACHSGAAAAYQPTTLRIHPPTTRVAYDNGNCFDSIPKPVLRRSGWGASFLPMGPPVAVVVPLSPRCQHIARSPTAYHTHCPAAAKEKTNASVIEEKSGRDGVWPSRHSGQKATRSLAELAKECERRPVHVAANSPRAPRPRPTLCSTRRPRPPFL